MNYQTTVSLEEDKVKTKKKEKKVYNHKPTPAFIGASWTALLIGMVAYCVGLWNATMELNEKGYYFTILLFGLFSVISVQKAVRDKLEGIQVTEMYYGISWFTSIAAIVLHVPTRCGAPSCRERAPLRHMFATAATTPRLE